MLAGRGTSSGGYLASQLGLRKRSKNGSLQASSSPSLSATAGTLFAGFIALFRFTKSQEALRPVRESPASAQPLQSGATKLPRAMKDDFHSLRTAARPTAVKIAKEAKITQKTEDGQTLLFAAAGRPPSKGKSVDVCLILAERGLSCTHKTSKNENALFEAVPFMYCSLRVAVGDGLFASELRGRP